MVWPPPPAAVHPQGSLHALGLGGLGLPLGTCQEGETGRAGAAAGAPRNSSPRRGRPRACHVQATLASKPGDPAAPLPQHVVTVKSPWDGPALGQCQVPESVNEGGKQKQKVEAHRGPPEGCCPFRDRSTGQRRAERAWPSSTASLQAQLSVPPPSSRLQGSGLKPTTPRMQTPLQNLVSLGFCLFVFCFFN